MCPYPGNRRPGPRRVVVQRRILPAKRGHASAPRYVAVAWSMAGNEAAEVSAAWLLPMVVDIWFELAGHIMHGIEVQCGPFGPQNQFTRVWCGA